MVTRTITLTDDQASRLAALARGLALREETVVRKAADRGVDAFERVRNRDLWREIRRQLERAD